MTTDFIERWSQSEFFMPCGSIKSMSLAAFARLVPSSMITWEGDAVPKAACNLAFVEAELLELFREVPIADYDDSHPHGRFAALRHESDLLLREFGGENAPTALVDLNSRWILTRPDAWRTVFGENQLRGSVFCVRPGLVRAFRWR